MCVCGYCRCCCFFCFIFFNRSVELENSFVSGGGRGRRWRQRRQRRPFCDGATSGAPFLSPFVPFCSNCWLICINQARRGRVSGNRLRFVTCSNPTSLAASVFVFFVFLVFLLVLPASDFSINERSLRINYPPPTPTYPHPPTPFNAVNVETDITVEIPD